MPNDKKQTLPKDMVEALQAPIPLEFVSVHESKSYLNTFKAYYVIERLNEVFGLCRWEVEHEIIDMREEYVTMKGRIVLLDYNLQTPYQYGGHKTTGNEPADGFKSAVTSITSKCSSFLGIGREVFLGQVKAAGDKPASSKPAGDKPNCPICKDAKYVITNNYGDEDWLCWNKKGEDKWNGCGKKFNTAPPPDEQPDEPPTPQPTGELTYKPPAPQPTYPQPKGKPSLLSQLNDLASSDKFSQIPGENKEKILGYLEIESKLDPNHEGFVGWIKYLKNFYTNIDNNTEKEIKYLDQSEIDLLMGTAAEMGLKDAEVKSELKTVYNIDSKKKIPLDKFDEILRHFTGDVSVPDEKPDDVPF